MNKTVIVVSLAVVALLITGYQQLRVRRLQAELEASQRADSAAVATQAAASLPVVERAAAPAPAAAAPSTPAAPAVAPTAPARPSQPGLGDFMKNVGSMMTNPAMKELVRSQTKMQLEMQFERLFKYLDLAPEQLTALKDLLMERQMALVDGGMAFMSGDVPPEERRRKAEEMKSIKEAYDKKVAQLLGAEGYEAFKQYEDTQPERMQAELFKRSIASSGEPLTDQQEYDLVSAMHTARTNAPPSPLTQNKDTLPEPGQFTEENVKKTLESLEAMQAQYATSAQSILTPAQFTEFEKFMKQQKQMNEMGIRFAAQMFGGTPAAPPAAPKAAP